MLPLFNVSLPANIGMVFYILMRIAAIDIIPTDTIYDATFDLEPTEPVSINFAAVGLESKWLIYNLGSITLIALFIVFLMILVALSNQCHIHSSI